MIREITVEELDNLSKPVLIDVRSEGEFEEATIPGSLNIPLLDNTERAEVGTVYAKVSTHAARELGLKIVSPKLPSLVNKVQELSKQGPLVIFCWRGGMRSKSICNVLETMGISAYRLQGGYKAYRRMVNDFFDQNFPFHIVVLRGNTGVGKTEVLNRLRQDGYPALDLEKLANNRGSVFGDIGLGASPTQKNFEALIFEEIKTFNCQPYIVVECESKRIGRVILPSSFHAAMQQGIQVLLHDTVTNRVKRLLNEYTSVPDAVNQIKLALNRLTKILGHKKISEYHLLLEEGRLDEFTEKLLDYYDSLYRYPNEPSSQFEYSIDCSEPDKGLRELEQYLDQIFSSRKERDLFRIQHSAK